MVSGRFALFSDPVTRVGGEKSSYPVPTYQAMVGILESVYWKPTIIWIIDRMRVMNPIKTRSKGVKPLKYNGGNDLALYCYLQDVAYQVEAHFVWNLQRPDLEVDRNENKHHEIAKRMIARGGRRDVFLGARECQAYVESCDFGAGIGAYDDLEEMYFGVMIHGINYPDDTGRSQLEARLWRPVMRKGVIEFVSPEDCPIVRPLIGYGTTAFRLGENCSPCDGLLDELGHEAVTVS